MANIANAPVAMRSARDPLVHASAAATMTTAETFTAGKIDGVKINAATAAATTGNTRLSVGCDSSRRAIPATTAPPQNIQVSTCRSECPSNPADPAATHAADSASTTASTVEIGV